MKKVRDIALYITGILYALVLLDVFFRLGIVSSGHGAVRQYNFIPMQSILAYLRGENGLSKSLAVQNVLGNMLIFIPLGLYIQMLKRNKSWIRSIGFLLCLSAGIEILQYWLILGAADIDDVILNGCGGMAGIILYRFIRRMAPQPEKTKTAVTILLLIVCLPVIAVYSGVVLHRL